MICLELPWAADKAVQQLGRVHRSNQLHPPAFICLVTDLAGEARFVSAVTRRLRNLGAMTRGDRHAGLGTSGDAFGFGRLDLMSGPYGAAGLAKLGRDLTRGETDLRLSLSAWPGGWQEYAPEAQRELMALGVPLTEQPTALGDKKGSKSLKRFLNRLLATKMHLQQGLFEHLGAHVKRLEDADRRDGTLDNGVISLNRHVRWGRLAGIQEIDEPEPLPGGVSLTLRRLRLDRGLAWEKAKALLEDASSRVQSQCDETEDSAQGFYMRPLEYAPAEPLLVLRRRVEAAVQPSETVYTVLYPNKAASHSLESCLCTRAHLLSSPLLRCDTPQDLEELEKRWREQYIASASKCIHRQRGQNCSAALGAGCHQGLRCIEETMLTGQIVAHWDLLAGVLGQSPLVRAVLDCGRVLVGKVVPARAREKLCEVFAARAKELSLRQQAKSSFPFDGEDSSDATNSSEEASGSIVAEAIAAPRWAGEAPPQVPPRKRPWEADEEEDVLLVSSEGEGETTKAEQPQRRSSASSLAAPAMASGWLRAKGPRSGPGPVAALAAVAAERRQRQRIREGPAFPSPAAAARSGGGEEAVQPPSRPTLRAEGRLEALRARVAERQQQRLRAAEVAATAMDEAASADKRAEGRLDALRARVAERQQQRLRAAEVAATAMDEAASADKRAEGRLDALRARVAERQQQRLRAAEVAPTPMDEAASADKAETPTQEGGPPRGRLDRVRSPPKYHGEVGWKRG